MTHIQTHENQNPDPEPCEDYEGDGFDLMPADCPDCMGTGDMADWEKLWRGYYGDDFVPCQRCGGTGVLS